MADSHLVAHECLRDVVVYANAKFELRFRGFYAYDARNVFDERHEVIVYGNYIHFSALNFREVEYVVDDGEQIHAGLSYRKHVFLGARQFLFAYGEFRHAQNGVHGGTYLVAHHCQELAFIPRGGFQGIHCATQGFKKTGYEYVKDEDYKRDQNEHYHKYHGYRAFIIAYGIGHYRDGVPTERGDGA